MEHIWKFSPSSEDLLQKCIDASLPPDENNKWFRAFGKKNVKDDSKHNHSEDQKKELDVIKENNNANPHRNYEELIEMIENESTICFHRIAEEFNKNHNVFPYLTQKLSISAIEKIFKQIFMSPKSEGFLLNFYKVFIPMTIKRKNTRFVLDFLVLSKDNHTKYLGILLDVLVRDLEIPRNILNDYILTLTIQEQNEFMKYILNMDLDPESFLNNLPIVLSIYKTCNKSNDIQNEILQTLKHNSEYCKNDRQFGKLLLTFLQTEKSLGAVCDTKAVKEIIDSHRSPFKRPCEIIFNDILGGKS